MTEMIWLIICPLLTAFSLLAIDIYLKKIYKIVIVGSGILTFLLSFNLLRQVLIEPVVYSLGDWEVTKGINLIADPLAGILVFTISGLILLAILYSASYIKKKQTKYYILLFLLTAALNCIVLTGDLFNLFVCLEIVSIVSYALVAFNRNIKSYEASFKYLIIGSLGGFFILLAIILIYQQTGTLNLAQLIVKSDLLSSKINKSIFPLLLIGFGSKFALVPLHTWLPDAHPAAPAPISALLSGIVIKAYLYAWLRILLILSSPVELIASNWNIILLYFGVITLLVGHLLAYQQQNLKRLLAYSSISQIGYIMIGIGLFNQLGISGSLFHIINHALVKSALFLAAGVFSKRLAAKSIDSLEGAGYRVPIVGGLFTLSALTIIGLPPFNIFISKWLIATEAIKAGFIVPAGAILLGSILALCYYLKVIKVLYTKNSTYQVKSIDWKLKLPIAILSISCLILGLKPDLILPKLQQAVVYLLKTKHYYQILFN
ncbi:MAG: proton-conducting transporter membrane subunit [Halanaerobacter sp.]